MEQVPEHVATQDIHSERMGSSAAVTKGHPLTFSWRSTAEGEGAALQLEGTGGGGGANHQA